MKRITTFSTSIILLSSALSLSAQAGTIGLSGEYTGSYRVQVKTNYNAVMANGTQARSWRFDFNNQQAYISDGYIRATIFPLQFKYRAYSPMPLTDNGDGTYTVHYDFQVFNPLYGNPKAQTKAVFEITRLNNGDLDIKTLDSDRDGVIGEAIRGVFPYTIELNWFGNAKPVF